MSVVTITKSVYEQVVKLAQHLQPSSDESITDEVALFFQVKQRKQRTSKAKEPKVDMSKFSDQTDKIEGVFARTKSEEELAINLLGIQNAANAINSGKTQIDYFPDGKIDVGAMFMSGVNYFRDTFYETDPITGERREKI